MDYAVEIDSKANFNNMQEHLYQEPQSTNNGMSELSKKTGMLIKEYKGQRVYGPPLDFNGCFPPEGSGVFVGGIPRNCHDTELISYFQRVGRLHQMRVVLSPDGNNKGYCFVTYSSPEEAQKAIRELNKSEIWKGWQIGVLPCISRTTIFISNIPRHVEEEEIKHQIDKCGNGITRISAPMSMLVEHNNRGYAFVEFENQNFAMDFMAKFYPANLILWENVIKIQWADSPPESQGIIVINISPKTSEKDLIAIFNKASDGGVIRLDRMDNRAYIHFKFRHMAKIAKSLMNNKIIDGHMIKVQMSNELMRRAMSQDISKGFQAENGNCDSTRSFSAPNQNELHRSHHNDCFQGESQQNGTSYLYNHQMMNPPTAVNTFNPNAYIQIHQLPTEGQMWSNTAAQFSHPTYTHQPAPFFANYPYNGSTANGHYLYIPPIQPTVPVDTNYYHPLPSFVRPINFYH